MTACTGREAGTLAPVEGFAGLVAGDEPRAVVIGRDVLGNGGNAIDTAVAMYFTMAVTMPSRVSLGGGGVCVLFQGETERGEAIEFLPRAAPSGGMVPSSMRAMAALHARFGALRWEQLLSPAETLARFGHAVSRAFVKDLDAAATRINASPELQRIFSARSGNLARPGDRIFQLELSGVIGGIRRRGAAYLHSGPFTRRLAEASSAVGMPLTTDDIRNSLPKVRDAVAIPLTKRDVAFFAPPRATGGIVAAQIWQMSAEVEDFAGAGPEERPHLVAEAAARAFSQRVGWMEPDGSSREDPATLVDEDRLERVMAGYDAGRHTPAGSLSPAPVAISAQAYSAGFVVADQWLNAVACSFTMNRLFGAARMAEGTGILLAAPPRSQNDGSTELTAVVVGNTNTGDIRFAGTASGGPVAATALAGVMLRTLDDDETLESAVAAPRTHHGGAPDLLLHEAALGESGRAALARRGHSLREVPALGRVNALHCPDGLKDEPETCSVVTDPRGFGLAYAAQ